MIGIAVIAVVALLILAASTVRMWAAEHQAAAFQEHADQALQIGASQ